MKNILYIITFAILFVGCNDKSTEPELSVTGNADFSVFVSIGNSVTAGFQSNSLFERGQKYSYPNLIAKQVNTPFTQPIISEPGVHISRIIYKGVSTGGWFKFDEQHDRGELTNASYPSPYNNLAVPGAHLEDVLHTTNMFNAVGGINPFFDLILRNYDKNYGTQFQQAKRLKPTFLTLWIGNNDILGYATSGASGDEPTSGEDFHSAYKDLIDSIKILNTSVVTANIPDVTVLPYFTAINVSFMDNGTEVQYYGRTKTGIRKLVQGSDFITLTAASFIFNSDGYRTNRGLTESDPLDDNYVLDNTEINFIRTRISEFNSSIQNLSSAAGFSTVDLHSLFNLLKTADAQNGIQIDGERLKTDFVTGGIFSFDGVHPSERGQGIIANEFIKVINADFKASIPLINISAIPDIVPRNTIIAIQ